MAKKLQPPSFGHDTMMPNSDKGEISGCAEIAVYEVALSEPQQSLTQMVKASFLGRGNNITLA